VSRSPSRPEFFLDRSLGRHEVAAALRAAGWLVRTHFEVFGSRDEEVPDVEWLEYCGNEGLVVLSKDRRLRYRPAEISAIRRHRVRAFVLTGGSLRAAEQAARFVMHADAIAEAAAEPAPLVYAVHRDRIARIFP
jgi:hypothetical protein